MAAPAAHLRQQGPINADLCAHHPELVSAFAIAASVSQDEGGHPSTRGLGVMGHALSPIMPSAQSGQHRLVAWGGTSMAKASTLLEGRVNCRKVSSGRYEVGIDGESWGFVGGGSGLGYWWEERPDKVWPKRSDAVDMLVLHLMDEGSLDPNARARNLREEALITPQVKSTVYARDQGFCQYCLIVGRRREGTEYDHFVPAGAGGSGTAENVQLACDECNRRKWHHHPKDLFGAEWEHWGPGKDRTHITNRNWQPSQTHP